MKVNASYVKLKPKTYVICQKSVDIRRNGRLIYTISEMPLILCWSFNSLYQVTILLLKETDQELCPFLCQACRVVEGDGCGILCLDIDSATSPCTIAFHFRSAIYLTQVNTDLGFFMTFHIGVYFPEIISLIINFVESICYSSHHSLEVS